MAWLHSKNVLVVIWKTTDGVSCLGVYKNTQHAAMCIARRILDSDEGPDELTDEESDMLREETTDEISGGLDMWVKECRQTSSLYPWEYESEGRDLFIVEQHEVE